MEVCQKPSALGISEARAGWLRVWLADRARLETVNLWEFRLVLGRLTFVASVLEYERPFLSLMFSWVSAVQDKARARLPWAILFVMRWLAKGLQEGGRLVVVAALPYGLGETFRADAKAENGRAWLGG